MCPRVFRFRIWRFGLRGRTQGVHWARADRLSLASTLAQCLQLQLAHDLICDLAMNRLGRRPIQGSGRGTMEANGQYNAATVSVTNALERIVADPSIHARFLNTLSRLEYVGARKLMKSQGLR